jgi:general secretion pathway protein G
MLREKSLKKSEKRRLNEKGMTLLEIMVVITIIGIVMSIVGVAVMKQLEKSKKDAACLQIRNFEEALDHYKLEKGTYPSTEEGLAALIQAGKLKGKAVPKDPWGRDYIYIYPGVNNQDGPDIMSYGADGREGGTGDGEDLTNWGPPCVK